MCEGKDGEPVTRLFVVRHGVTAWNAEGRWQGHTDVSLTDEGIAQAHGVARRLAKERVDAVWSSDLSRARMTAEIIAEHHRLPVATTPALREQRLGDWEG